MPTALLNPVIALVAAALLVACGSHTPVKSAHKPGGYYKDDGPGDRSAAELDRIADAVPRAEPLHRFANRTYVALGNTYPPVAERKPYVAEGVASWYGKRFHGKKTASGEPYDMYGMSAAHPTLPIPSYVRVTALGSGKSVVVRVNDRGPFHSSRLIDLSYAAAHKLGVTLKGSLRVRVESVLPDALDSSAADASGADTASSDGITLQVGAFLREENAESLARRVRQRLKLDATTVRVREVDNFYRVLVGPYPDETAARVIEDRLRERMGLDAVRYTPERARPARPAIESGDASASPARLLGSLPTPSMEIFW
jgi:rare lipoprotein A